MKIVLTGGGTAGHAMVNKVMIPWLLKDEGDKVIYIGSHKGAERSLVESEEDITYYPISTGKLRRYLSLKNVLDFFKVFAGILEAYRILKKEEVNVVFSGGGFVSLPVVFAAHFLKIPVIIRETDRSIGLTNRICIPLANKIYTTFPDTLYQLQGRDCEWGGIIVRPELLEKERAVSNKEDLPTMLIMGGSLGSEKINQTVWEQAEELCRHFKVIHLCGRGKTQTGFSVSGYSQYEYAENMEKLYGQADIVVTRCGSNAISEGLALGKRMICIPLSSKYSRGEQLANAKYAVLHGNAAILTEEGLCAETMIKIAKKLLKKPINRECLLDKDKLSCNCHQLLKEIRKEGMENLQARMIHNIKKDRKINWDLLSPWEMNMYEEIAEEYKY